MDPQIAAFFPGIRGKIVVSTPEALFNAILKGDNCTDVLMLRDVTVEATLPEALETAVKNYQKRGGFYRVDPERSRQEGSFYLWAGLNKFADVAALISTYKARFDEMVAELGHQDRAYVFGTGPTFSDYVAKHDFDGSLCIAANSIVKNGAALRRLRPRIICAADPIYHAGCSTYAGTFRASLVEALEATGAWFVCPLRDSGVYQSFLPPHLARRLVCVPFDAKQPISANLTESFHLTPFPNVLTLMLLPLAATFADGIHIVGCDGRRMLDDSFFWSHDKKVQFNDELEDIKQAHPGFFAIDYNDYYLDHCSDLENVLSRLEEAGHPIVTETPSLIPALHQRERGATEPAPARDLRHFVILDPDAKDDWGHFLAYDKQLAAAVAAQGLDFVVMSRTELHEKYRPADAAALIPVFSVNSWTVGNKNPPLRDKILQFAAELDQGLRSLRESGYEGEVCLFFYVGSLEVAEILEFLLCEHSGVHAVINLFWSYNFDQNDPAYRKRWLPVMRRLVTHPRIHLLHATEQIAEEFVRDWGIDLPVLCHPSTTFSDRSAQKLAKIPPRITRDGGRCRVVFPGGARPEKGFILGIEATGLLQGNPELSVVFRSRIDNVSGPLLRQAYDSMDKTGVEIIDQDLSDDEFIAMIEGADIVVLPYHSEAFRRRTSGILVDAMLLGKPIVVLEDTWLADAVDRNGIGVSVPATAEAVAAGVDRIVANYQSFAERITATRQDYLRLNSWSALATAVCALVTTSPKCGRTSAIDSLAGNHERIVLHFAAMLLLGEVVHAEPYPPEVVEALAALPDTHALKVHLRRIEDFVSLPRRIDVRASCRAGLGQGGS